MPNSFWELIEQGGLAMYPLVLCSVLSVAVILERLWSFYRIVPLTRQSLAQLMPLLKQKGTADVLAYCRAHPLPLTAMLQAGLDRVEGSVEVVSRVVERKRQEQIHQLKSHLWVLGTIGSSAPFIGLFGTVLGIIKSFHNMALTGSGGFAVVGAGISEALIATAAGLLIAVLSVVAYNYFLVRVSSIAMVLKGCAEEFIDTLAEMRARSGSV